jgi:hypothetical protein
LSQSTATTHAYPGASRRVLLAWAGWQLTLPEDWRPLKLNGNADKGWMMVGDAVCAMFSVHWERVPEMRPTDGRAWVEGRLKRQGVPVSSPNPPAKEHFTVCAWAHALQTREDKYTTFWYGYSADAGIVLGIKVNGVLPRHQLNQITRHVMPSVRASSMKDESIWAMYNVCFRAPAGFELINRHLYSGDVALEFAKGRSEALLLRQVYPGDLALSRRSFEQWLDASPFKGHRKLRSSETTHEAWPHEDEEGLRRTGRKRLAFPLGVIAPRHTCAVALHDKSLNRLLIAEHTASSEIDMRVCEQAVAHMSQALLEGE